MRRFKIESNTIDLSTTEGNQEFLYSLQEFIDKTSLSEYESGWKQIFDVVDFTGTRKNSFSMIDVNNGLLMQAVKPGESPRILKVSGKDIVVDFDLYGNAIGLARSWFENKEWWKIEEIVTWFVSNWYLAQANAHFNLIDASCFDEGYFPESNNVTTINKACESILEYMSNNGFEVSPLSRLVLLTPIRHITKMYHLLDSDRIKFNLDIVPTSLIMPKDYPYHHCFVILPGRTMKSGNRMDLTILSEPKVIEYAESVAGWGRYGAIIGDVNQLRRISIL